MKPILRLFPKFLLTKILASLLLEQSLVAASTYCLIRASSLAVHSAVEAWPWVLGFLFCLATPYVPGIFARRNLEDLIQNSYQKFLRQSFPVEGEGIRQWAHRAKKENFLIAVTAEAQGQIRQVAMTVFDLTAVVLNVVLNLAVLGYHFHPVIAAAFSLGTVLAYLIFRSCSMRIEQTATAAQIEKSELFARVQRSWDNMFAAHAIHRRPFSQALVEAQSRSHRAAKQAVTWAEVVSVMTTYSIMIPVLVAVVGLITQNMTSAFMLSLLTTLPRQFQVMGNIQVFLSYMTAITGISAQAHALIKMTEVEALATEYFVSHDRLNVLDVSEASKAAELKAREVTQKIASGIYTQGRFCIRGPNGAGKSSWLVALQSELKERAYFLPAQPDYWLEVDNRSLSSGQKILETLRFAEGRGLPPVLLLDEWDANLDLENQSLVNRTLDKLAERHLILEVRHHG